MRALDRDRWDLHLYRELINRSLFPAISRDSELNRGVWLIAVRGFTRRTYINRIIERTMLSDGGDNRLMVGRCIDGRELIKACGKTVGDIGSEFTAHSGGIQTLEESKLFGIGGSGLVERSELLDNDMRVALDLTLCVELLGCGKVVLLRVDEETGLHVLDLHLHCEWRIGFQSPKVLGEGELG